MTRLERHKQMDRARVKLHEQIGEFELTLGLTDADMTTVLLQIIADLNAITREHEEVDRIEAERAFRTKGQ